MTAYVSPLAADVIGIIGSICFIAGFAYANMTRALNHLWFNILNLAGAILLLVSLSVHFNLAAVVLEVAWGAIALLGIGKALLDRRKSNTAYSHNTGATCAPNSPADQP